MYKSVFVHDIHNQLTTSVNPESSCIRMGSVRISEVLNIVEPRLSEHLVSVRHLDGGYQNDTSGATPINDSVCESNKRCPELLQMCYSACRLESKKRKFAGIGT